MKTRKFNVAFVILAFVFVGGLLMTIFGGICSAPTSNAICNNMNTSTGLGVAIAGGVLMGLVFFTFLILVCITLMACCCEMHEPMIDYAMGNRE